MISGIGTTLVLLPQIIMVAIGVRPDMRCPPHRLPPALLDP
jgi:hypothetical protein